MHLLQQLLFIIVLIAAVYLFARKVRDIRRNILLGRDFIPAGTPAERWRNTWLFALGQKTMFRKPLVGVLHFFVYAGFIIINIEILEIILDGALGSHRLFAPVLGGLYPVLIGCFEILAVLVIIGCAVFLVRRNALKIRRFMSHDLDGWPRSDANYILVTEIALMLLFLTMNASDQVLQSRGEEHYIATGSFWISGLFTPLLDGMSSSSLMMLERTCWWLHILGVLAFLNYLPYSKHLHIVLAFPNTYYTDVRPKGKMENMPSVQREVQLMLQPEQAGSEPPANGIPKFGAKDVPDLTWKNLLDAYSCTECGRCTAACPANITGKKLSPRKIMMETRDRAEEIGRIIKQQGKFEDDGKTLLHAHITTEELWACTTCNACVEECPVGINPLHIILQLRRYLVMEESNAPAEWNMMFSNIENNMAPWKFSPDDRDKWTQEA